MAVGAFSNRNRIPFISHLSPETNSGKIKMKNSPKKADEPPKGSGRNELFY